MAGGGGGLQVQGRVKRGKHKSKRKKMKRVGFVLDMTPLVDIAFLLLTFFMLTTTMTTPQVMDMAVPPEAKEVQVKESELFLLRIRGDGKIFYNIAIDKNPQPLKLKDLKKQVVAIHQKLKNRCITVLKVDDQVPYDLVVSILDELNLAELEIIPLVQPEKRERRFTMSPLEDKDKEEIGSL